MALLQTENMPDRMQKVLLLLLAVAFGGNGMAQQHPPTSAHIRHKMQQLRVLGSVLYIAAHPDDENTRLISWLANHQQVRTAYLSLTRGDGGQNLIGTEKGAAMGVLRTQELLEARKTDGGEQFFTRAVDFGYSKTPGETFQFWNKDTMLADVVGIIRRFQPDIIITRFPPDRTAGHGHHTASAVLAEQAFRLAGDPEMFPHQLKHVKPWSAKSLYHNTSTWWHKDLAEIARNNPDYAIADIGGYNPLLGVSYGEIASESRSKHRSQGFGAARQRGTKTEYLKWIDGAKTGKDLFANSDFSWNRIPGGKEVGKQIDALLKNYRDDAPAASLKALADIHAALQKLPEGNYRNLKIKEVENLMVACSGLWMEARAADYRYTVGDEIKITVMAVNRSEAGVALREVTIDHTKVEQAAVALPENQLLDWPVAVKAPRHTSQPYWLRKKFEGLFSVDDPALIGNPENAPALHANFHVEIAGAQFQVVRPVVYQWVDRADGELYSPLSIVPPVTANITGKVFLFKNNASQTVQVRATAHRDSISGTLQLKVPEGWSTGEAQAFQFEKKGESMLFNMVLTPPENASSGNIEVRISTSGATFNKGLVEMNYPHISRQTLLPVSKAKAVRLNLQTEGKNIGYVMGAGDEVPAGLEQVGYEVTLLHPAVLDTMALGHYDAIITGIRAYNTKEELAHQQKYLLEYARNGGTLIVQYNTNRGHKSETVSPYPIVWSRLRVTDETAKVTFALPEHPVLHHPNQLGTEDFENWVQERGLYFGSEWDEKYAAPLSWSDPGEKALAGGLLVCDFGKGHFIYTGISFFRQLPAGVPGAYRLFANLIGYGRP